MPDLEQITVSSLKTMKVKDFKRMGSFEVTADGELLAIVVVPTTSFIADSVRELCVLGESVRVREPETVSVNTEGAGDEKEEAQG